MLIESEDLLEYLRKNHPDKMLLDDADGFTRGKLAGAVETILEVESYIEHLNDEETNEEALDEPRY